jgi:hypothetical protein
MKSTLVIKDLALGKALDRKAMSAVRGGVGIPEPTSHTPPDLYPERGKTTGKGSPETYFTMTMEGAFITN